MVAYFISLFFGIFFIVGMIVICAFAHEHHYLSVLFGVPTADMWLANLPCACLSCIETVMETNFFCFRPETEEEKILKEEIDRLKKELDIESAMKSDKESTQGSGGEQSGLHNIILQKEQELEMLIRDLDDKVRFGQKPVERPGSGAGRAAGFPERPPSQSGSFDESRSVEFMDRPRSQGMGDVWTRPGDDRRGFQGGRERGFLGNRDMDR